METPINQSPTSQKKIILFNSSSFRELVCSQKFSHTVFDGYRSNKVENSMHYGSCGHLYFSTYEKTEGEPDIKHFVALTAATKLWKEVEPNMVTAYKKEYLDLKHLKATLAEWYDKEAGTDDFKVLRNSKGSPMVEVKFHVPYYSDEDVDVILVGTEDRIGKIDNGCFAIGDYKFTSYWDKNDFLSKFVASPQLKFYYLLIEEYAKAYPDSLYADMFRESEGNVGVFIDGVFLGNKETQFQRSEVFQIKNKMEAFRTQLDAIVKEIVELYKTYNYGFRIPNEGAFNGTCTSIYGKLCPYFHACHAPNNIIAQHVLKQNFVREEYGRGTYGMEEGVE